MDLRTDTKKDVLKGDWSSCSKYANNSRFHSQHDWGTKVEGVDISNNPPKSSTYARLLIRYSKHTLLRKVYLIGFAGICMLVAQCLMKNAI